MYVYNRVNRYRGLTSSAIVMKGLKPFEDTIYIDNVPVIRVQIRHGRVFVQFQVVEQIRIYA